MTEIYLHIHKKSARTRAHDVLAAYSRRGLGLQPGHFEGGAHAVVENGDISPRGGEGERARQLNEFTKNRKPLMATIVSKPWRAPPSVRAASDYPPRSLVNQFKGEIWGRTHQGCQLLWSKVHQD